ncbi:DNA-binding transcriptional regulator, MarR family [Mycolicibacterium rutilum]|uniref:DNA-binding transcriptional regulator, MarR family n=1 Tax=Mycolicibacterium rutilum TaxID=370526 RepID=A0A1H6KK58_MYCRU|nr:MarR family transcriptional regulator [Mycolicibacterium rutilum]SEH75833.1 DNA-binding transcriptional regulator, MarR family [Mycolicibacterium rutilum]
MTERREKDLDDSVDAITDALLTASRLLIGISARSIATVDESITITQFRTLVLLASRGPMKLATLATHLDVQPSSTGRMVDRLVTAGLVDRRQNPDSRREVVVSLTNRGQHLVRRVTVRRREHLARIVQQMAPSQRRGLVRALTAFTASGQEPAAADGLGDPMFTEI